MIRKPQSLYPVVAKTHPGMSGKNNEDRFGVTAFQLNKANPTPVLLAVLSDGIGGHKAGEVAAEIAVNQITQTAMESKGLEPIQIMQTGIERASHAIHAESQKDTGKQGMGATIAIAWMIGHRLYTASVGDSRIYFIRGDRIRQVSVDHTWIQEALDNNLLTPEQVEGHPNRHVIRRYLGGPTPPEIDFRLVMAHGEADQIALNNQGVTLQTGDRLVLTSDGLTDLVSDAEILAAFDVNDTNKAVDDLINLANQRGGHDNITVISFEIPDGMQVVPKKRSFFPFGCILTTVIMAAVALLVLGFFWLQKTPINLGFLNRTQEPMQVTLNPMMTSAPQSTASPDTSSGPKLVSTATVLPLSPRTPQTEGYPPPDETVLTPVTPQAYP